MAPGLAKWLLTLLAVWLAVAGSPRFADARAVPLLGSRRDTDRFGIVFAVVDDNSPALSSWQGPSSLPRNWELVLFYTGPRESPLPPCPTCLAVLRAWAPRFRSYVEFLARQERFQDPWAAEREAIAQEARDDDAERACDLEALRELRAREAASERSRRALLLLQREEEREWGAVWDGDGGDEGGIDASRKTVRGEGTEPLDAQSAEKASVEREGNVGTRPEASSALGGSRRLAAERPAAQRGALGDAKRIGNGVRIGIAGGAAAAATRRESRAAPAHAPKSHPTTISGITLSERKLEEVFVAPVPPRMEAAASKRSSWWFGRSAEKSADADAREDAQADEAGEPGQAGGENGNGNERRGASSSSSPSSSSTLSLFSSSSSSSSSSPSRTLKVLGARARARRHRAAARAARLAALPAFRGVRGPDEQDADGFQWHYEHHRRRQSKRRLLEAESGETEPGKQDTELGEEARGKRNRTDGAPHSLSPLLPTRVLSSSSSSASSSSSSSSSSDSSSSSSALSSSPSPCPLSSSSSAPLSSFVRGLRGFSSSPLLSTSNFVSYRASDPRGYSHVMLLDDRARISPDDLSRTFALARRHGLWLSSPSVCDPASTPWRVMHRVGDGRSEGVLRFTDFVEIIAPLVTAPTLRDVVFPSLGRDTEVGWGLDAAWAAAMGFPERKMGVVDAVCIDLVALDKDVENERLSALLRRPEDELALTLASTATTRDVVEGQGHVFMGADTVATLLRNGTVVPAPPREHPGGLRVGNDPRRMTGTVNGIEDDQRRAERLVGGHGGGTTTTKTNRKQPKRSTPFTHHAEKDRGALATTTTYGNDEEEENGTPQGKRAVRVDVPDQPFPLEPEVRPDPTLIRQLERTARLGPMLKANASNDGDHKGVNDRGSSASLRGRGATKAAFLPSASSSASLLSLSSLSSSSALPAQRSDVSPTSRGRGGAIGGLFHALGKAFGFVIDLGDLEEVREHEAAYDEWARRDRSDRKERFGDDRSIGTARGARGTWESASKRGSRSTTPTGQVVNARADAGVTTDDSAVLSSLPLTLSSSSSSSSSEEDASVVLSSLPALSLLDRSVGPFAARGAVPSAVASSLLFAVPAATVERAADALAVERREQAADALREARRNEARGTEQRMQLQALSTEAETETTTTGRKPGRRKEALSTSSSSFSSPSFSSSSRSSAIGRLGRLVGGRGRAVARQSAQSAGLASVSRGEDVALDVTARSRASSLAPMTSWSRAFVALATMATLALLALRWNAGTQTRPKGASARSRSGSPGASAPSQASARADGVSSARQPSGFSVTASRVFPGSPATARVAVQTASSKREE